LCQFGFPVFQPDFSIFILLFHNGLLNEDGFFIFDFHFHVFVKEVVIFTIVTDSHEHVNQFVSPLFAEVLTANRFVAKATALVYGDQL
jgi:hypothetical protein